MPENFLLYCDEPAYPWQAEVLASQAKVRLVYGARQVGKTMLAMDLFGSAPRHLRALLLVASLSQKQSIRHVYGMDSGEIVHPMPTLQDRLRNLDLLIIDDCFLTSWMCRDHDIDLGNLVHKLIFEAATRVVLLSVPTGHAPWISSLYKNAHCVSQFGIHTWQVSMFDVGKTEHAKVLLETLSLAKIQSDVYGKEPKLECQYCNGPLVRRKGESWSAWTNRKFCSVACAVAYAKQARPQLPAETKTCVVCGATFTKRRNETKVKWAQHKFCSLRCAGKAHMKENPTRQAWAARQRHLKKDHCEVCGKTKADGVRLDLHHVTRQRSDPTGAMTVCAGCHTHLHWEEDYRQQGIKKPVGRPRKVEASA